jgi:hypothetical protein
MGAAWSIAFAGTRQKHGKTQKKSKDFFKSLLLDWFLNYTVTAYTMTLMRSRLYFYHGLSVLNCDVST